jgi:ribosomal protein L11 methylase PrmA
MVDRDALAVEYSRQNAELNELSGVTVLPGLGYEAVGSATFDLIASNLPAKAGKRAIEQFLLGAGEHLEPDGIVAVVVVAPVAATVAGLLEGRAEVMLKRSTKGYTVLHYGLPPGSKPAAAPGSLEVYERGRMTLRWPGLEFEVRTAHSLPEFDSLSFASQLAAQELFALAAGRQVRSVVVLHPGQGHLAVLTWRLFGPREVRLVDRDLLALDYTLDNLRRNGCPREGAVAFHQAFVRGGDAVAASADLILGLLPDKGPAEAAARELTTVCRQASRGARAIVAGTSTAVTRCLGVLERDGAGLTTVRRSRNRGHSAVTLRAAGT